MMALFEHRVAPWAGLPQPQRRRMLLLWLTVTMSALSADKIESVLWLALYLALAAGMNDRIGALIAACLTLALLLA
jgi:hypothetical protein